MIKSAALQSTVILRLVPPELNRSCRALTNQLQRNRAAALPFFRSVESCRNVN